MSRAVSKPNKTPGGIIPWCLNEVIGRFENFVFPGLLARPKKRKKPSQ